MAEKRKSAFMRATQEAQARLVSQNDSETVKQLDREEVVEPKKQDAFQNVSTSHASTVVPQVREEVKPLDRDDTIQSNGKTVLQQSSEAVRKSEKISFYLTPEETRKLNDLEYEQRNRTGRRVNRNDLIRHLIDICTSESFDGM